VKGTADCQGPNPPLLSRPHYDRGLWRPTSSYGASIWAHLGKRSGGRRRLRATPYRFLPKNQAGAKAANEARMTRIARALTGSMPVLSAPTTDHLSENLECASTRRPQALFRSSQFVVTTLGTT
jgi:hypothetical protein